MTLTNNEQNVIQIGIKIAIFGQKITKIAMRLRTSIYQSGFAIQQRAHKTKVFGWMIFQILTCPKKLSFLS